MLASITFCVAVSLAVIAVVLLALFSPVPHKEPVKNTRPWLALSLYIQQPQVGGSNLHTLAASDAGALVFHRALTKGPENTSVVVGKAQGSLSIQANNIAQKEKERLSVVGGTGSFAFARGLAVFAQTDNSNASYHIKLHMKFPNRSQTIPG